MPVELLKRGAHASMLAAFWVNLGEFRKFTMPFSYLIPFICLPTQFDPNTPKSSIAQDRRDLLKWMLSLTNAELVILALLVLNTFVGISTCFCVCARRKCLGRKTQNI